MSFIDEIRKKAIKKEKKPTIVFPESHDARIREAAKIIERKNIAKTFILENKYKQNKKKIEEYAKELFRLRQHKGLNLDEARNLLTDKIYYATMMVHMNDADAVISGSLTPSTHTIKAALQVLKKGYASSFFIMEKKDKVFLFADCALNPDPTAEQLAIIAEDTAKSAKELGIHPRIAMLSFSTKGSAQHEMAEKVKKATELAKKAGRKHGFLVEGELQADAALVKEVARLKAPKSKILGDANILIFPNLDAGNIGYKLVQRLGGYKAIGPVIQGLEKPVNDLSRGCSVQDIIDLAAVTSLQVEK